MSFPRKRKDDLTFKYKRIYKTHSESIEKGIKN